MRKWLNRIQAWNSRRERRALQWWEQERAKGKSRFISHTALTFGVTVVAVLDILDHVIGGEPDNLLLRFIAYTATGIVGAFFAWNNWEAKYKKALLKARD